ncbi:MAG: hypothetical protein M3417_07145, partial [Actinomycetota bacterium]|nr:hypothetical protein [Actinomycetota bacterium]
VAAGEAADRAVAGAPEPRFDPPTMIGEPIRPTPTVPLSSASLDRPAGTAAPSGDWSRTDAGADAATPAPDPLSSTPPGSTPPDTPESGLRAKARALTESDLVAKAKALPESDFVAKAKALPESDFVAKAKALPESDLVVKARALEKDDVVAQARALTERPEVMVGLAFAGGVLGSFVLKLLGR